MSVLSSASRRKLETTVKTARPAAEEGARSALEALAVHEAEPYPHMDLADKRLRNQLRARARQLGDAQTKDGRITLQRLVHECAYEHWHRMLFARFLAENGLLVEPESGMAVSLEECQELAAGEKLDLWTYASRCAQRMLPMIFRPHDPLLQVAFAPEHRLKLEGLLGNLETEVFTADDSLGWVYQFWRADEKDAVNKAGEKINADTLPAVTQLFTEHYMVEFLLHNTLGAWWAGKRIQAAGGTFQAKTEEEARRAVSLPGLDWTYLRFTRAEDAQTPNPQLSTLNSQLVPAAGTFPGWPRTVRELRAIDPCCGSGHFLVALLHLLVAMRREEEGLSAEEAVRAVLEENLHGLEIDARCSQLAAFNVAFAAWKIIGRPVDLPPLHIACSGLAVSGTREEWLKAVEGSGTELRFFLGQLYDLFKKAPELGSLINPARLIGGSMHADKLAPLLQTLDSAFAREEAAKRTLAPEEYERGVTAQGLARAAQLLAGRYHLTVTNVPYLGRGNQDEVLKEFIETHYPVGKSDLATAFVLRCLEFCIDGGVISVVTPQNWLFLKSYTQIREQLLTNSEWDGVARLGHGAFETITGEVVNVCLAILTRRHPREGHEIVSLDVSAERGIPDKANGLRVNKATMVSQESQLQNPDSRVVLADVGHAPSLGTVATSFQGLKTGDDGYFRRCFWEHDSVHKPWRFFQSTVSRSELYAGKEAVLRYEKSGADIARNQGAAAWGRVGVAASQMSALPCTIYLGDAFDSNVAPLLPNAPALLPALWVFCSSPDFRQEVRKLDPKVAVANGTFASVPFDLAHWQKVAAEKYPDGLPKPHSDDPTQWLFSGHPCGATEPLQVAVARLVGYRWPRQTGSEIPDCPALGEDGLEAFADADGIVCLSAIQGEAPAADQLQRLLAAAYGKDWSTTQLHRLLEAVAFGGKSLEDWLRDGFFTQHCALFHQRPFIWHIWDGLRGGFSALVNYHKLAAPDGEGRKLLEKLTYTYLGEWITRQQEAKRNGAAGADDRLTAALELKKRLEAILTGEPPFDLFVRWKPLHQQPIGWEPDVNDGVRLNIRPFLASDLPAGKKGAGILRVRPNVKWDKDRGKEPRRSREEFPWFWGWDGTTVDFTGGDSFTGDRWNDCHYTNAAKRTARAKSS